jgi:hypothetical protein
MNESSAYRIFLEHQDWRKKFGGLLRLPSGEGNKENEKKSASGVKIKSQSSKIYQEDYESQ